MPVKGRFSLDTNILVYAVDRDAGERHVRSGELMARAARRDRVLTVPALAEFFHATTRKSCSSHPWRAPSCAIGSTSSMSSPPATRP